MAPRKAKSIPVENTLNQVVEDLGEENKEVNLSLRDHEMEESMNLKEVGNEENFNIFELQKKITDPYDDELNVDENQIEKEIGWKKISDNVLKGKNKSLK